MPDDPVSGGPPGSPGAMDDGGRGRCPVGGGVGLHVRAVGRHGHGCGGERGRHAQPGGRLEGHPADALEVHLRPRVQLRAHDRVDGLAVDASHRSTCRAGSRRPPATACRGRAPSGRRSTRSGRSSPIAPRGTRRSPAAPSRRTSRRRGHRGSTRTRRRGTSAEARRARRSRSSLPRSTSCGEVDDDARAPVRGRTSCGRGRCRAPASAPRICSSVGRGRCVTTSYVCRFDAKSSLTTVRFSSIADHSPSSPSTSTAGNATGSHWLVRSMISTDVVYSVTRTPSSTLTSASPSSRGVVPPTSGSQTRPVNSESVAARRYGVVDASLRSAQHLRLPRLTQVAAELERRVDGVAAGGEAGAGLRVGDRQQRCRRDGDDDGDRADAGCHGRHAARRACSAAARRVSRVRVSARSRNRMPAASSTNDVTSTSLGHGDRGDQRDRDQPDGREQRHPRGQHDVIDDDREQADRADRQEREGHAGIQGRGAERDLLGGRLERAAARCGRSPASG